MGLSAERMRQIVDDLYEANGSGDFDRAASMLTDDFFITEADSLPMAGVYRGKNSLRDLFLKVFGMVEVAALERHAMMIGDDHVVVHLSFQFADPSLKPAELCEMFRFRGEQVCEIRPFYFDPATIVAAVEAKARVPAG